MAVKGNNNSLLNDLAVTSPAKRVDELSNHFENYEIDFEIHV